MSDFISGWNQFWELTHGGFLKTFGATIAAGCVMGVGRLFMVLLVKAWNLR